MSAERRFWSATFVNGLGILLSPFASITLQAVNYRRAGLISDERVCWFWFGALFIAGLIWSQIPLHVPGDEHLILGFLYAIATWVVWFVGYGRKHRAKIGQLPGTQVELRSPFTALMVAFGVWFVVSAVQLAAIFGIDYLRR